MATRTTTRSQKSVDGKRPNLEQDLDKKFGVKFSYLAGVSTSAFDVVKSQHNQARNEAIDDAVATSYAEAMERGDIFPAVVAWKPPGSSSYVMIDGNHRLVGHIRADMPTMDLYEIDPDTAPQTIARMTFALNATHGMKTSVAERIQQAIYLVDNGASAKAAAAELSLREQEVKRAITRSAADRRADMVRFPRNKWDTINSGIRGRLTNISTDEGFADAAELAYRAHLDLGEVNDLIAKLNASGRSGIKQRAIVKAETEIYHERIQTNAGGVMSTNGRRPMTVKARAGLALSQTLALPDDDRALVNAYAPPERETAAKRYSEAADRLHRISDLLLEGVGGE